MSEVERRIRSIEVFDISETGAFDMTLNEFIKWIVEDITNDVPEEFRDSIRIYGEKEYVECDSWTVVKASYKRPETDSELQARLDSIRHQFAQEAFAARREYDRLKAKFGF
jgi:hypothetical protein